MERYRPSVPILIWLLIGINFAVFLMTQINEDLFYSLGLQPHIFWERPWTIVTNLFVHDRNFIGHILFNMIALFFFGTTLTRLVREGNFLLIYFAGGILGNVFYILLGPSYSIVVGASGAIFALGGALAVMVPRLPVIIFPIPAPIPIWVAVIGGFLLLSFFPGVAWQAHLGGLLFGLVAGYYFQKRVRYFG